MVENVHCSVSEIIAAFFKVLFDVLSPPARQAGGDRMESAL